MISSLRQSNTQNSQRAFLIQVNPRGGNQFNPLSIPLPQQNAFSLANLPTSLDIENHANNNQSNSRDVNFFIVQFQGSNSNHGQGLQFVQSQIASNIEFYRGQTRQITINQQTFTVKPYLERDLSDQQNSNVLQQLQDEYGVYINQLQFTSLISLGQQINEKVNTDISVQFLFMIIQVLCLIPTICYFGLANTLFSQNIASDIYFLLILITNVLITVNRYLLYKNLLVIYNEIEYENYKSPQVVLFLIHIRDKLGIKSVYTLTRSQIQESLQKSFNTNIIKSLNTLNCIQYTMLFFSIYFCINSSDYSTKIRNQNSLTGLLAMSYTSLIISLLYFTVYAFTFLTLGLTLGTFAILCAIGFVIYQIFYYIFFLGNRIATIFCGVKDYFENDNQIAPISETATYQFYAEAYVKRNTKQIIYSSQRCKDTLCSICLEEYVEGQTQLKQMVCCKSAFHISCINNWALEKKTCPNCRSEDIFTLNQKRRVQYYQQIRGMINNSNQPQNEQNPSQNGLSINSQEAQNQQQNQQEAQNQIQFEQQQPQIQQEQLLQQQQQQQRNDNQEHSQLNHSSSGNLRGLENNQNFNSSIQTIQLQRINNGNDNLNGIEQHLESLKNLQDHQIQSPVERQIQPISQVEIDDNHILHNHRKSDQNFLTLINIGKVEKRDSQSIEDIKDQEEVQKFDSYNSIKIENKITQIKSKNQVKSLAQIQTSNQELGSKTQFINDQQEHQKEEHNKLCSLDCFDKQQEPNNTNKNQP